MALTDKQWQTIERRSGVPRRVMQVLLGYGERSGQSSVSPMGAFGRAQLMPQTARNLERKYKISTKGEFGNVLGGALYLGEQKKNFGNWRLAFAAYNAGPGAVQEYHGVPPYKETRDYVKRTMAALTKGGPAPSMETPGTPGSPATPGFPGIPASKRTIYGVKPNYAKIAAETMFQAAQSSNDYDPLDFFQRLVSEKQRAANTPRTIRIPGIPATRGTPGTPGTPGTASYGPAGSKERVLVAKGANRSGVTLQPDILAFARAVAGTFGQPLRITTGTNHNQFVAGTNRQSAHWTGEAADLAASGKRLTRMGQAALIAAGANPVWARKQTGGLFNINGRQIIFNSMEGGNHYDHLHIGIRGHG
jgi:hypothetical protein